MGSASAGAVTPTHTLVKDKRREDSPPPDQPGALRYFPMTEASIKAVLDFFKDPCNAFAEVLKLQPGEYQVERRRGRATVRVVRDWRCRVAVDLMRSIGTLLKDGPCVVYSAKAGRIIMAYLVPKDVAAIAVKERNTVTLYILE